jgi:hypothetical protein
MAMLNRLDQRQTSLGDRAAATSRAIAPAFDEFVARTIIRGGNAATEIAAFLEDHPDPLAVQTASAARASKTEAAIAPVPQLVEESAISKPVPSSNFAPLAIPPHTRRDLLSGKPATPQPCACPADRKSVLLEPV